MVSIESVAAIVDIIEKWEDKFFDKGKGYPAIWYRGQGDKSWPLLPGTLRPNFIQALDTEESLTSTSNARKLFVRERTLNKQFQRLGASYYHGSASLVDVYLLAQHHGLPTSTVSRASLGIIPQGRRALMGRFGGV